MCGLVQIICSFCVYGIFISALLYSAIGTKHRLDWHFSPPKKILARDTRNRKGGQNCWIKQQRIFAQKLLAAMWAREYFIQGSAALFIDQHISADLDLVA